MTEGTWQSLKFFPKVNSRNLGTKFFPKRVQRTPGEWETWVPGNFLKKIDLTGWELGPHRQSFGAGLNPAPWSFWGGLSGFCGFFSFWRAPARIPCGAWFGRARSFVFGAGFGGFAKRVANRPLVDGSQIGRSSSGEGLFFRRLPAPVLAHAFGACLRYPLGSSTWVTRLLLGRPERDS